VAPVEPTVEFLINERFAQLLIDDDLPKTVESKDAGRRLVLRIARGNHRFAVTSCDGQRTTRGLFSVNAGERNFKTVELKPRRPVPGRFTDRTAAEFILGIGGSVEIVVGNRYVTVALPENLPAGPFRLNAITANNSRMNDLVIKALAESRLEVLSGLDVSGTPVSDAGLAEGRKLLVHRLFLDGRRVTDRGLAFLREYRGLGYLILGGPSITNKG